MLHKIFTEHLLYIGHAQVNKVGDTCIQTKYFKISCNDRGKHQMWWRY